MPRRPVARTIVAAVLCSLAAASVPAAYVSQQSQRLDQLRQNSATPVAVDFRGGFPISVTMALPSPGSSPTLRARNFLTAYADLFQQDHPKVELVHIKTRQEPEGESHSHFAQRYDGFPVFGAEIVVIERAFAGAGNLLTATHGALLIPATIDRTPAVELEFDGTPEVLKETAEQLAREALELPQAELGGLTELVVHDPQVFGTTGAPRLAWRVTVKSDVDQLFLIDAIDGVVLLQAPMDPTTSGLDGYDMELHHAAWTSMQDIDCGTASGPNEKIGTEDGILPGYFNDLEAHRAWNYAEDAYLMYHDLLDRHSFDDDDGLLKVFVHAHFGAFEPNASSSTTCDGIQFSSGWAGKDIVAHEFAHLTTNLTYADQSGALNESYADIMASAVDTNDWLIGEGIVGVSGGLRNLADPPSRDCLNWACPDRMSSYIWTSQDNGGVHLNSNIVSKAYQLFADGGTFNGYAVAAQGRARMAVLAYRTTMGLPNNASFQVARNAAVAEANALAYWGTDGFTAQSLCAIRNAFAAVEIGNGDADCDGVEDHALDSDNDGVPNDGDGSGSTWDNRCHRYSMGLCDDNCRDIPNPSQSDSDYDGRGDICDPDDDNDGFPDSIDPCPGPDNRPWDQDGDGIPACLDEDDDDDGVIDDADGSGDIYDNPCPSGVTSGCDDNCPGLKNPQQIDTDGNGQGDVCDPDNDNDGYFQTDNCPFTHNPLQADSDSDGLGDSCDGCPNTYDTVQAWDPGNASANIPPFPIQPDSDGDGIPDACDIVQMDWTPNLGGSIYSHDNAIKANESTAWLSLAGPPGDGRVLRFPIFPCEDGSNSDLAPNSRIEMVFQEFPESIVGWVEQADGAVVARFQPHVSTPNTRGLRFQPRCDQDHYLMLKPTEEFEEPAAIYTVAYTSPPTDSNPWGSASSIFVESPPPLPDEDGDGLVDGVDTCPLVADPSGVDADDDGLGDVCDVCPTLSNPEQGPVPFGQIRGDKLTGSGSGLQFSWDIPETSTPFETISGLLGLAGQYQIDRQASGQGTSHTFPDTGTDSRYFLYRHPDPCGTWGTTARDLGFGN